MGPVGKTREPLIVILLTLVTFGIYGLYWEYKLFAEMKEHSGEGVGGPIGLLLSLVTGGLVAVFLLPHEAGGIQSLRGREKSISWLTGFWVLIPLIGFFIWVFRVQGTLNEYWASVPTAGTGGDEPSSAA